MRASVGADAARRCAQRAGAALRAEITARAEALAAVEDLAARNAHYEVLWDLIVEGSDNIAYRLALTTLVERQQVASVSAAAVAGELGDAAAIRALAEAIAAGDDERAFTVARGLLERSIPPEAGAEIARGARGEEIVIVAAILYYAIPFFVLLLVAEYASFRHLGDDHEELVGYDLRDTGTSLTMGIGNVVINVVWKLVVVAVYAALYELTPLRLDPHNPLTWVALFFADDLAYYWFHRVSHESRVFWASHVVHHSSQHYNLSTALRQTWVPMTYFPFWLALPLLGFPVWMVLLAQAWSLIYQFWIHTERIVRLPRAVEGVMNTPSHHRVHHGMNDVYLDRNYGGILIIWDRLFGSFEPECERVRYGLTTQLDTFHPVKVAFHEYAALARDVRHARGARTKLQTAFRGPGWEAAGHGSAGRRGDRARARPAGSAGGERRAGVAAAARASWRCGPRAVLAGRRVLRASAPGAATPTCAAPCRPRLRPRSRGSGPGRRTRSCGRRPSRTGSGGWRRACTREARFRQAARRRTST